MTLRELQEALEEEVLTRQSLSRELEAIRTANQNFARSESGRPGPSLPSAARLAWAREGSRSSALRSQLREAEARNRDLEAHVRQLQEQMELLQARGDAGESLMRPLSRGRRGEVGRGVCGHLGAGEGPRLGHAAPPPSSVPPRALCLSLLLPAVTGVPSPRATDLPSHVRPLFFPCIKPFSPSADPAPSPRPDSGITLTLGGSREQTPSIQPHVYQIPLGPGL